jgi:hypothetical protein
MIVNAVNSFSIETYTFGVKFARIRSSSERHEIQQIGQ